MTQFYEFRCRICGNKPEGAQAAVSLYGYARLTTAFYRRFACLLYEREHLPFRQMIFPYTELSGLCGGADGYLVLPRDPFVVMAEEEDFPRLKETAENAFAQAQSDFMGPFVLSKQAGLLPSPSMTLDISCEGEAVSRTDAPDDREFRTLLYESPLTRPLWDYLHARHGQPVHFGEAALRGQNELAAHYERRQWAGKLLAAGETASRMIRGAGGFVLASGGTKIAWLCPPERADELFLKLTTFIKDLQ